MAKRITGAAAKEIIGAWIANDYFDEEAVDDFHDESEEDEVDNVEVEESTDEDEQDVEDIAPATDDIMLSKDGLTRWSKKVPAKQGRRAAADIVRNVPGPATNVILEKASDAFALFFEDAVLEKILEWTNQEAVRVCAERGYKKTFKLFTLSELKAFLGLLFVIGVTKGRNESINQLWGEEWGRPFLRATMSKSRFEGFLQFIRFDDKESRAERRVTDKLAAIREVTDVFSNRCKEKYIPSEQVTVDEMLSAYRGKCPFRVYIPSKPAKYGIKIWIIADVPTGYCTYFQVYTGKINNVPEKGQGVRVVKDLCTHLYGSGRNVTTDNFFTDVTLAQHLLDNSLTLVGTLRKSKGCIPREMLPNAKRELLSSVFGFSDKMTIVSYVPKKNKAVTLLSTAHHDNVISSECHKKPEVILTYNSTKGAVDTLDKMCRQYTVKRSTRRWPLTLFFTLLDIAAHNASVIWFHQHPEWVDSANTNQKDRRRAFILEMGKSMCLPWIDSRRSTPCVSGRTSIKRALEYVNLPVPTTTQNDTVITPQRGRCHMCDRKNDTKTKHRCSTCGQFVCGNHSTQLFTCTECS